jgi:DNA-binding IclR family transcriptional regulator
MQQLADLTKESVAVTVAIQNQAICIDMIEGTHSLRCSFVKGRSVPLRDGATAKCLLAHLPERDREAFLQEEYPDLDAREERRQRLQDIRHLGYTHSDSEVDQGVWGVSFPLFARNKFILGAITLMAPSQRVTHQQDHLIQLTSSAAKRINNKLQHN